MDGRLLTGAGGRGDVLEGAGARGQGGGAEGVVGLEEGN